ncbi:CDP-glycerol glycerophosphotransferase family protein [Weissella soli]|uniref:CDP-glycerol glycerophosphotransferase n=1 Tax=Weissella soli TaxID=155866 RepID=A0A288Q7R3_9LACO|nr:CDP-glycerol glycerophosphotransferase family protein [Weissella soli]AOT57115.1 CDP-glycerol glycerophosphotransferase [Weissella soli]MCT8395770.1 CDP-glycerol--glycerophosphate glycerophosphotransferase [Weissella soli]NKY83913.1 CDP-glycerol--glycerophosphate glycerophosphotransferase [Weissella soli]RDL01125.1 CDP-glycerol glycerophosphotransferase [Weissella soli]GEN93828.1 hypothetical protein WSO01_14400 [Weissella soli]
MKLLKGLNQVWKNRIKNSTHLGEWYHFVAVLYVKILQLLFPVNQKQILFVSYSGRQYSDSPKELYLQLSQDPRFTDYKLIWALNEPDKVPSIPAENKISANKISYFYHLVRSKYWVANSSIDRLLAFKHPNNIYIQFWHGIPLKKLGPHEKGLSRLVKSWYKNVEFDYFFTHNTYDEGIFKTVFPKTKQFVQTGSLRFDVIERRKHNLDKYRETLQLDPHKPTILYVPTFREYTPAMATGFSEAYFKHLTNHYNVLYRGHYFKLGQNYKNVTTVNKESLYKLFWIADILVTDYSSAIFEFLPFNKPIYFFEPDITEYQQRRGLYLSPEALGFPVAHSEFEFDELLENKPNLKRVIKATRDEYLPVELRDKTREFIINKILLQTID